MLRLTKRADYGLMAMHYIATQAEHGAVSTKRIAEQFNIPAELLAKILQRLAKKRLIERHNGSEGRLRPVPAGRTRSPSAKWCARWRGRSGS